MRLSATLSVLVMGVIIAASCTLDRTGGIEASGGFGGMGGGDGLAGFGGMMSCNDKDDCGVDNDCRTVSCVQGTCMIDNADPGTDCTDPMEPEAATCNGMGQCVQCALPGDCIIGTCTNNMQVAGEICMDGACLEVGSPVACAPYTCDAAGTTCLVNCADSSNCVANSFCDLADSQCKPRGMPGDPCTVDEGCLMGVCSADGVCCDALCNGECESCLATENMVADGICDPIPFGDDPGVECAFGYGCEGNRSCIDCGESITEEVGGACPMACTNCAGGECNINCNDTTTCDGTTITCPAGWDCDINCSGNDNCRNVNVVCPPGRNCDVNCAVATHTCQNIVVECADGPCNVACLGAGGNHCDGATIECGLNQCAANCSEADGPAIDQSIVPCGTNFDGQCTP
jgi:hypothetical protein